jgi:hypothetical protein
MSKTADYNICEPYLKAKTYKNKGQNLILNAERPLKLVYTDISGPYTPSLNKNNILYPL